MEIGNGKKNIEKVKMKSKKRVTVEEFGLFSSSQAQIEQLMQGTKNQQRARWKWLAAGK